MRSGGDRRVHLLLVVRAHPRHGRLRPRWRPRPDHRLRIRPDAGRYRRPVRQRALHRNTGRRAEDRAAARRARLHPELHRLPDPRDDRCRVAEPGQAGPDRHLHCRGHRRSGGGRAALRHPARPAGHAGAARAPVVGGACEVRPARAGHDRHRRDTRARTIALTPLRRIHRDRRPLRLDRSAHYAERLDDGWFPAGLGQPADRRAYCFFFFAFRGARCPAARPSDAQRLSSSASS